MNGRIVRTFRIVADLFVFLVLAWVGVEEFRRDGHPIVPFVAAYLWLKDAVRDHGRTR